MNSTLTSIRPYLFYKVSFDNILYILFVVIYSYYKARPAHYKALNTIQAH